MTLSAKRLIVGISGASGMIYAIRLIRALPRDWQVHLILSEVAKKIMKTEMGWDCNGEKLVDYLQKKYGAATFKGKIIREPADNYFAAVASGSFFTAGMVVVPCSMKTLSGIANGYANSLIERAADVTLKERRPLILVVRETPYNQLHLKNMLQASQAGAIILPASPGFYHHPQSIEELADFVVGRALNLLHIEQNVFKGWRETD